MAISATSYSPKDFQLAFIPETTIGTQVIASAMLINIDSIELPSLNPQQVLDIRHGLGRTLKAVDIFVSNSLAVKEISFSGVADNIVMPELVENITGDTSDTYAILNNYEPSAMKVGTGSISDTAHTVTVILDNPSSGYQMVFPGCVLTTLTVSADIAEESGRFKVSGTFKTGMIADLSPGSAATFGNTAHFNDNYYMSEYAVGESGATVQVAGISDPVLKSFSFTIENDAQFMGFDDDGNYQVIQRAIPEVVVTLDAVIKYDGQTEGLIETFNSQTSASTVSNQLTMATANTAGDFNIDIDNSIITDVSFSEEEAMFLSVSQRAIASSTPGNAFFTITANAS
jgi:hypothetical protein